MESFKRRVPKVEPVSQSGIRYEVVAGAKSRGFARNGGVIAALDEATGKECWTLQVYSVDYDPSEEEDVQDVFIVRLALSQDGRSLIVEDERHKRYEVSLEHRSVREIGSP
jgi:hypothetical protein